MSTANQKRFYKSKSGLNFINYYYICRQMQTGQESCLESLFNQRIFFNSKFANLKVKHPWKNRLTMKSSYYGYFSITMCCLEKLLKWLILLLAIFFCLFFRFEYTVNFSIIMTIEKWLVSYKVNFGFHIYNTSKIIDEERTDIFNILFGARSLLTYDSFAFLLFSKI